jgi:hypothetical protein
MKVKKMISSLIIGAFITTSVANSAIILFPVGLLFLFSPGCNNAPGLCLFLEDQNVEQSIQSKMAMNYPFLDELALENLSALISDQVPSKLSDKGTVINIDRQTLVEQILLPSGAMDFYPTLSEQLIEDFK